MKILILTNIMTPYRKYLFDLINKELIKESGELKVLVMSETESDRSWKYDDYKTSYTKLLKGKTINIKIMNKNIDIHLNYNYIKEIKKFNPDRIILGGSWIYPSIITTLLYFKLNMKHKKILFWSESHSKEQRIDKKINFKYKVQSIIYSGFDGFIVPGELAKDYVNKFCKTNKKVIMLPNIIDESLFLERYQKNIDNKEKLCEKYSIKSDEFVFICPARLTWVKGVVPFINNACDLFRNNKNKLLIAGNGELEEEIKLIIEDNNLNIKLLGEKTQEEMIELYSISNALLLPSLSDPYPLSAIEAAWCKLPLVMSEYVGNYPELITDENGIIFDTLNRNDVIDKVKKFCYQSEEWMESARNKSLKIVQERFYGPKIVKTFIKDMKNII